MLMVMQVQGQHESLLPTYIVMVLVLNRIREVACVEKEVEEVGRCLWPKPCSGGQGSSQGTRSQPAIPLTASAVHPQLLPASASPCRTYLATSRVPDILGGESGDDRWASQGRGHTQSGALIHRAAQPVSRSQ